MSAVCQYVLEHGGALLAAATCLLALGCAGITLQRSAIHRQRSAEAAILAVLVWLALACVPLPRYSLYEFSSNDQLVQGPLPVPQAEAHPPSVPEPVEVDTLAQLRHEKDKPKPADASLPETNGAVSNGVTGLSAVSEDRALPLGTAAPANSAENRAPVTADHTRAVPASPPFDARYYFSILYVGGAVGCFAWLVLGRALLLWMRLGASEPERWLQRLYEEIPFSGHRRPWLLVSNRCVRPLSFGIRRPTILLPGDACRPDGAEPLRHVLLHELAHARQRDAWGRLLFNVAFPLLYFHPLYWWIRSRAYLASELIADDQAAGLAAKESYVEALVALVKQRGGRPLTCLSIPQIFGSRSQFYRRMQMLLKRETRLSPRCSRGWRAVCATAWLLAVVVVAGAVGMRPVHAQQDEPPAADKPSSEPAAADAPSAEPAVAAQNAPILEAAPAQKPVPALEPAPAPEIPAPESEPGRDELHRQLVELQKKVRNIRDKLAQTRFEAAVQYSKALEILKRIPELRADGGALYIKVLEALKASKGKPQDQEAELPMVPYAAGRPPRPDPFPRGPDGRSGANRAASTASTIEPQATLIALPVAESATGATRRASSFVRAATGAAQPGLDGGGLDLIRLATEYTDAIGDLEIAKLRHDNFVQANETNADTLPAHDVETAAINVKTAERKVALLRAIAKSALRAAEAGHGVLHSRYKSASNSDDRSAKASLRARIVQAESRIEILGSILTAAPE